MPTAPSLDIQLRAALELELKAMRVRAPGIPAVAWMIPTEVRPPLATLAVVAADAGNVELRLSPLRIAFVRVADSSGHAPLAEVLFSCADGAEGATAAVRCGAPEIVGRLEDAGVDVAAVIAGAFKRPDIASGVRELLEWGALLDVVARASDSPRLIVRDGLFRSILLAQPEFECVKRALRRSVARNGHILVAVAKSMPGGADLVNHLLLTGALDAAPDVPLAWLAVPRGVEDAVFPPAYAKSQRMGELLLVRDRETGTLTPIEVARSEDAESAVLAVFGSGVEWYPQPGQLIDLLVAHERAKVSPLEREQWRQTFLAALAGSNPGLAKRARLAELLGRGGVSAGAEEQ